MIGAISGDIIGSEYEFNNISNEDFGPLFSDKSAYTDDTVLTVATADVIMNEGSYASVYYEYARSHPDRGYGGTFSAMISTGSLEPYDSYGNGSAMRVSPVGWAYDTMGETFKQAKFSAECTHNHEEGIKGAKAISVAIWLARNDAYKDKIVEEVEGLGYDLSKVPDDFKQGEFDVTCQGTIPRVMSVFVHTDGFESGMRRLVAMGGDVDTNCCIFGAIAEAFYGLPDGIVEEVYMRLPRDMADITTAFVRKHVNENFQEPSVEIGSMTKMEDKLSSLFSDGPAVV